MNGVLTNGLAALPDRSGGAARVSIFFALWSLALVLLHDVRVNAAPIYETSPQSVPGWWIAPVAVPKLGSESMWNALSERSDVISGRWRAESAVGAIDAVSKPERKVHNERVEAPKARPASSPQTTAALKKAITPSAAQTEVARHIALRDFAGALEALALVREEDPTATDQLRLFEAHIAIGQGDSERAYSILIESLPDVRVSTQQHDLLAAVMLRTSRYAQAAAIYRALLTVDPANARWWAGYAVSQEQLDHRGELILAYRALRSLAAPGTPLAAWAGQRLASIG